jgi:prepilin-type N-terminal cleavage/methylation domain-containing protein
MYQRTSTERGFTLIELLLAMAFFTSILMVSTVVLVQVFNVYNKGISVKQMNSVGRMLTDDIIRASNSAAGSVAVGRDSSLKARCLNVGGKIYIWSYASDFDAPTLPSEAYKYDASTLVNFARYDDPAQTTCPSAAASINPNNVSEILGSTARVYAAELTTLGGSDDVLALKLTIGTYAGKNAPNNPVIVGGVASCTADQVGTFCAFGNYQTIIYLPN